MTDIKVLIAAAGTGSRAGLPYPKTLFPIQGEPILVRILNLMREIDPCPTVVVSPSGRDQVAECLAAQGLSAHLVLQPEPLGMGDAVLRFRDSPAFPTARHLLLIWGDIPMVQPETVRALVQAHQEHGNDFTLVTKLVDTAYTVVRRDAERTITEVIETREAGLEPGPGERDIGLFLMRAAPVLDLLPRELPGKFGKKTGEHGFLYLIGHLSRLGFKVEGLPVAHDLDLVSLNSLKDIQAYL